MDVADLKNVLIVGMSGGLAKITAGLLVKHYPQISIIGIDPRESPQIIKHPSVIFQKMRYSRGNFEKLFRNNQFDLIIHLGRMSHASANPKAQLAERLDLNLMGTRLILDLSIKYHCKKVIILSTYHVYGALADNPAFLNEESPLRASIRHPELHDVVEMDQIATNWMWKNQHAIETLVMRPCSIVGPQIKNAITRYLTTPYAPLAIDYNPMFQFIHEFDMANLLVHSITNFPTGVYNIAPDEVISIRAAKKLVGKPVLSLPLFLVHPMATMINHTLRSIPDYLIDYLKFSLLLDNQQIKSRLPEDFFRFSTRDALALLKSLEW
ncbi:MAG: NAD-dependent epimerase/dehydratase family protein [Bdellovibrionales bacterium]|jgi:UDP-glucose 4-epimerase|nr:NAD-dependent epimerase/dehydratase family protein [Bdellovibrionales bacterium]MBT3526873.1 NAD-dependent epimerase/dehydratase family protein [Bdellovibrionales bacterium]MBT7765790.1 NAD-dependent epimerase/dehydratase family protein [Bdellovibrionales bacterium]